MGQTYTINSYQSDHSGQTDLQNMETNFETIRSSFSGASQPANAIAGMPWFDTTNKTFKIRNNANNAWMGVMYGTASTKIWIYLNAAGDGWTVDGSLTDRVIAIKGGSQAYNVAGANPAGSWTLPAHTHYHTHTFSSGSHVHQWHDSAGSHTTTDKTYNSSGVATNIGSTGKEDGMGIKVGTGVSGTDGYYESCLSNDAYTSPVTVSGTTAASAVAGGGVTTFRPAAAVGTLQYPAI
jgi:hypothetical protein